MPSQISPTIAQVKSKSEISVMSRSQERRLATLHSRKHTLIFDEGQSTALCSCDGWELADQQHPLSLDQAKRNHALHVEMTAHKAPSTKTIEAEWISTIPKRLTHLVDKFCIQARCHPAFVALTPSAIRQLVEHKLFTIVGGYPEWYGTRSAPKQATEKQLTALAKARAARTRLTEEEQERERRLEERVHATQAS